MKQGRSQRMSVQQAGARAPAPSHGMEALPPKALAAAVASVLGLALPGAALAGNSTLNIDGRTATSVVENGTAYDVTTSTLHGRSAFNSFTDFQVAAGDTVKLHLPSGADNLINLVWDSQALINGTLNSYKGDSNGTVTGGRVFFADPHGVVVGQGGVLNVGSISISTPTRDFMDGMLGAGGSVDDARLTTFLQGGAPLADGDDATVDIQGRVNARDSIRIRARAIDSSGVLYVAGGNGDDALTTAVNLGDGATPTLVADGDTIRLIAEASDSAATGYANAEASIAIDGTLHAGDIDASATAAASSEWSSDAVDLVADGADKLIGFVAGVSIGVVQAKAQASVTVGATAQLQATDDVTLAARTTETVNTEASKLGSGSIVNKKAGAAGVYGGIDADATVSIASGAAVHAGDALSVQARTDNTLDISASSVTTGTQPVNATLAWSNVDVDSEATIAAGADVQAGSLSLAARNANSFSTAANAMSNPEGKVGIAGAVSLQDVNAHAVNGADIDGIGNVLIEAGSVTDQNVTRATVAVASTSLTMKMKQQQGDLTDAIVGKITDGLKKLTGKVGDQKADPAAAGDSTTPFRLGSAVTYADTSHNASAELADGASINATGDVAIHADVVDAGIQNQANSTVDSETSQPSGDDAGTMSKVSLSAGVSYGHYEHDAQARVGKGSAISAAHIGVGSELKVPTGANWTDFGSLDDITGKLNTTLGVADQVLTTYTSAKSKAGDAAIGGAVNYYQVDNDNRAWVDDDATLTSTATGTDPWNTTLATGEAIDWAQAVSVQALTEVSSIHVVGAIGLPIPAMSTSAGDEGAAVGGGFNDVVYHSDTVAGIGAGAKVVAGGDLGVHAQTRDQVVALSPMAGNGASVGINGTMAMTDLDDSTHASISRDAQVTANAVDIEALQNLFVWSVAGAFNMSNSLSVGVSVGVNHIGSDTAAYVGDNSADDADGRSSAASGGYVHSAALDVLARTDGEAGSVSVAGAVAKNSPPAQKPGFIDKLKGSVQSGVGGLRGKAADKFEKLPLLNKVADKVRGKQGGGGDDTQPAKPKFGLSISGSASVDLAELGTSARLDGAHVDGRDGGGNATTVQAINAAKLVSASGAAAITRAKADSSKFSGAMAGAVAYNLIDNDTQAYARDSVLANADQVAVRALSAGEQTGIAMGVAVDASGGSKPSMDVAGSFSIGQSDNSTQAWLDGSDVSGSAEGTDRALKISAYDRSRIGIGGGSLYVNLSEGNKNANIGAAFTYAETGDDTRAYIDGGNVGQYDTLDLAAIDSALIASAAAMGGGGAQANGLAGAFVFNDIGNTTHASIGNGADVVTTGDIGATASASAPVASLDALIGSDGLADTSGLDFSGTELFANAGETHSPGSSIISVAGLVQAGKNNVGLSFVGSDVHNTHEVSIDDATLDAGSGAVDLAAGDDTRIISLSVGVGVATGKFAGMGNATVNLIHNTDRVSVGDADASGLDTIIRAGSLDMQARDRSEIDSLAGNVTFSKGTAAGAAVTYNDIANTVENHLTHSTLELDGAASLAADNAATVLAGAVAGAASQSVALTGSLSWTESGSTVSSAIDGGSTITASDLSATANNAADIRTLAGSVAVSKQAAIGAAFDIADIHDHTSASLDDVGLALSGDAKLDASGSGQAYSLAVAGAAAAQNVAVAGSNADNLINNTVQASASGLSGVGTAQAQASSLDITATNEAGAYSLAGAVAAAKSAAVGGAVSVNVIGGDTTATLSDSVLGVTGSVNVESGAAATVQTLAAAAAGAQNAAVTGSFTTNVITRDVQAAIRNSALDEVNNVTTVSAHDASAIDSLAGAAGFAQNAGIGAAVAVNVIAGSVDATLDGGSADRLYHAKDVTVRADSGNPNSDGSANINTVAIGVGGGVDVGGAADVAVNSMSGSVNASIGSGAHVVAENNVGVLAHNRQGIDVFAGSAGLSATLAGVGLGVVVNDIQNTTGATITGADTRVSALAKDASDTLQVASGDLADPGATDVSAIKGADDYAAPDLSESTVRISGVAVNAASQQAIATLGASAGVSFNPEGSFALSAISGTNVLGGTTSATIEDARINQENDGAGSGQSVDVRASNHAASANFIFGAAGGTTDVGATAAVASNVFTQSTTAAIEGATTTALQGVNVDATASQSSVGLAVGLAGAIVGGAGSGVINVFEAGTGAHVAGGTLSSGSLTVDAEDVDSASLIGGSAAAGAVGAAGTFLVGVSAVETTAYVGDSTQDTTLDLGGDLTVDARTDTALQAIAVSGALGGGTGVAGMAVANVVSNDTSAYLHRALVGQGDHAAGAISVQAHDALDLQAYSGALGIGLGGQGIGAAANVAVLSSTVSAAIADSTITTGNDVDVGADSTRDIDAVTLTAGVGQTSGIGGAASLILLGLGDRGDAMDELDKGGDGTLSKLGSLTGGERIDASVTGAQFTEADRQRLNDASAFDLEQAMGGGADGAYASISNSTIAAASLDVGADTGTGITNRAGGLGAGLGLGLGGALAYTGVYDTADAGIDDRSTVTVTNGIEVDAHAGDHGGEHASHAEAYAGGAGLVGLGAAIAIAHVDQAVEATAGGTLAGGSDDTLHIAASDDSSVDASGYGAAVGAAAAGVVVVTAQKDSDVDAQLTSNTLYGGSPALTGVSGFRGLDVRADGAGAVTAYGVGASGGLTVAGTGVGVTAEDDSDVAAGIGDKAAVSVGSGGTSVDASATPQTSATAIGASVGGSVGLGASVALATAGVNVSAHIGDSVKLTGGDLWLGASATPLDDSTDAAHAKAVAGAGGVLLGANASVATAGNTSTVVADTGSGVTLPTDDADIVATNQTRQSAQSLGVAVGLVAVGASVAEATSDTVTTAALGAGAIGHGAQATDANGNLLVDADGQPIYTAMGTLNVHAMGVDSNTARSTAGSGGLVAGNAAVANTRSDAVVNAVLGNFSDTNHDGQPDGTAANAVDTALLVAAMQVDAEHEARYAGYADSTNAAALGASGASVDNDTDANVNALIGADALVASIGTIGVQAENRYYSDTEGDAVRAAGGGVASGQAALVNTTLDGATHAGVGDRAILATGTDPDGDPSEIDVIADTRAQTADSGSLATGAGIDIAVVKAAASGDFANTVDIGEGAHFNTYGYINLGTYTQASLGATALVNTWGLAAVGSSDSDVDIATAQQVNIGAGATLEAFKNINMTAGRDARGLHDTLLTASSNAQGYVRGLIAVPDSSASGHTSSVSSVAMGSGSNALGASNVTAGAYTGDRVLSVDGTGHGYELGFIPVTQHDSDSGSTEQGTLTLDGTILAGRYNTLDLDIDADGKLTQTGGMPVTVSHTNAFYPTAFLDGIGCGSAQSASDGCKALSALRGSVASGPVGAFFFGPMFAAGGDVFLQGDTIGGSGSVTAQGAPSISVVNHSDDYLVLDTMLVPDYAGGRVRFTGAASSAGDVQVSQAAAGVQPKIDIYNAWPGNNGPAIFAMGDIRNIGGLVRIRNDQGSLGQFATVYAQQQIVEAPNGIVTFSNLGADWFSGSNPQSDWNSMLLRPSGADDAVAYAANYQYGYNPTANLLYQPAPGADYDGRSIVLYGDCLPFAGGTCDGGPYGSTSFPSSEGDNPQSMPWVPGRTLSKIIDSYADNGAVASHASSSSFVGRQVYVRARYIDVNSTIDAGTGTNWSLKVDASVNAWMDQVNGGAAGVYEVPAQYLSSIGDGSRQIKAWYDTRTHRILVDNVNASGGGYVYLDGQIVSSTPYGKIKVSSGYGDVNIDSDATVPVTLQSVNVGNGAVGVVEIVDRLKGTVTGGDYYTTWYVSRQGQPTQGYDNRNGATSYDDANAYELANGTSYTPKGGMRYRWTDTAYFGRADRGNDWYWVDGSGRGVDDGQQWNVSGAGFYQGSAGGHVFEENITGYLNSGSGTNVYYHGCHGGDGSECNYGFHASYFDTSDQRDSKSGTWAAIWNYRFPDWGYVQLASSVKADNPIAIDFSSAGGGLVDVDAQGDIFIDGRISNVDGKTRLTATGHGGDSGAGDIVLGGEDAGITTHDLELTATGGIGTHEVVDPLAVTLTAGGALKAQAGVRGVYLDIASDAAVNISSHDSAGYGDVQVTANGTLTGVGGQTIDVSGRNITLHSRYGGMGSASDPLVLAAHETDRSDGSSSDGLVDAKALGDIALTDASGDFWIGKITSDTGDVQLASPQGSMLDARQRTAADTLTDDQIQDIWSRLHLDGSGVAGAVDAYEAQVIARYQEYWRLRGLGSVQDDAFVLNDNALALFRPLAEAAAGQQGLSDAAVRSYAAGRYDALGNFFESTFGSGWSVLSPFQQYEADYSYTVAAGSQTYTDLSKNAVWTQDQLKYAINANALEPASGAVGSADPNISGRNVSLTAANGIGRLASDLNIDYVDLSAGNLDVNQALALALANTPGDVVLIAPDGHVLTRAELEALTQADIDAGAIADVRIKRTSPLFVKVTGKLEGMAGDAAYLQANGDLRLGQLSAGSDVRLAAEGNLTGTTTDSAAVIAGGDLVLLSGNGSIGTAGSGDTPDASLLVDIAGRLLSASAGQSVLLRQLDGDLQVGNVFANGRIALDAADGSFLSYLDGVALDGHDITLTATGDIGHRDAMGQSGPLQVKLAASGVLDGVAGGKLWIVSPTQDLHVGTLHSGGDLTVTATQADLDADVLASDTGHVTAAAGADATLGRVDAAGSATLTAVGNLAANAVMAASAALSSGGTTRVGTIGTLGSTTIDSKGAMQLDEGGAIAAQHVDIDAASLDMGAGSAIAAAETIVATTVGDMRLGAVATATDAHDGSITLTAGGRIDGNADGQVNLVASTGATTLEAGAGIGTDALPLVASVPMLDAHAAGGDIHLSLPDGGTLGNVIADAGAVGIDSAADVDVGTIKAMTDLRADIDGDLQGTDLIARAGTLTVNAGGDAAIAGTTRAGTAVAFDADGALDLARVIAGTDARLDAGLGMTIGSAYAGRALDATAGGALQAQRLEVGGDATLASGGAMHVVQATVIGALNADSAGTLRLDKATVGTTATLDSDVSTALGELSTGGNLDADAGTTLDAQTLDVGGDATLASGGAMHVAQATIAGALAADSAGTLTLDKASIGKAATLHSAKSTVLGELSTGGNLIADAGTTLEAQTLDVGGDATLTSGDAMHVAQATITGALKADSADALTLDKASVGTDATLHSVASTTLGELTSGGDLIADAGTALDAQTLDVGGDATLTSGDAMHVVQATIAGALAADSADALTLDKAAVGTTATLHSTMATVLGELSTGSDLVANAGTTLDAQALDVGGDATLTSGGAMHVVQASIAGALKADSADTLALDKVTVGKAATLHSATSTVLGELSTGGDLDADAGSTLEAQTLDVGGNATLTSGGAMHVVQATIAGALKADSADALALDKVTVGKAATLHSATSTVLGELSTGGDLNADAGTTLEAQTLDVGGNATLTSGGAMHVAQAAIAGGLIADSGDALVLDKATVGAGAVLDSRAAMSIGELSTGGDLDADAGTRFDAYGLDVGGDAALTSGSDMHVAYADIDGTLGAHSGNALLLDKVAVGSHAALHSRAGTAIGELSVGGKLTADAGTTLDAQVLKVGRDAALTSGGAMHVVQGAITGSLTADSGDTLALDTMAVGADATLRSHGATSIGMLSAGGDLGATAGATFEAQTLEVGGDATLASGGAMHAAQATIAGALAATSADTLTLDTASVGADATLHSDAATVLGELSTGGNLAADAGTTFEAQTLDVGGDAALTSGDAMHVAQAAITGALAADSIGTLTLDTVSVGTDATLHSDAATVLGELSTGDNLAADAGTTLEAQTLDVGGDATLTSGDAMHVVQTTIAGALAADSAGTLTLDKASIGKAATLHSAKSTVLGELSTGGNLIADAGTTLEAQVLDVGGDATLTSGDAMHVMQASIAGALAADSADALTLDKATVGTTATLHSTMATGLGKLSTGSDLVADAGTTFDAQTLEVDGDAALASGGAMHVVQATITGVLKADSADALALGKVMVGKAATLHSAKSTVLGELSTGGNLIADAGTMLEAQVLDVGGDATLTSGDAMHLAQATIVGALAADAGAGMTLDTADTGGTTALQAAGPMTLGTLHGVGDVTLVSGDDLRFDRLRGDRDIDGTSAGSILGGSAQAGRNLRFHAAGDIRFDELVAGTDLALASGSSITGTTAKALAGSVLATASGDIGLDAVTAAQDVTLDAGHAITLGDIDAGRDLTLQAGTDLAFERLSAGAQAILVSRHGDIVGGALQAGGDADVRAFRDLRFDTAGTGGDLRLQAGRDLAGTRVEAGRGLDVAAGRDLRLHGYAVGADVALASGGDMVLGTGDSVGAQRLAVGGNLDFDHLASDTAFAMDVTGGYLHGGELVAPEADLAARDAIALDVVQIGERLNLASAEIDANVAQTRTDVPLSMVVTGYGNGVARRVHLSVDTSQPWMIERLAAVQAGLETTTQRVSLVDGHIEQDMRLTTPVANLWMDNTGARLGLADVQMLQPSHDFQLEQDGTYTFTDAFIVRYGRGYQVKVPNYLASHMWLNPDYLGESALRFTGRTLADGDDRDEDEDGMDLRNGAPRASQRDPVATEVHGAVNLGAPN